MRLIDADSLMEKLTKKKAGPATIRYTEGFNDALMRFRSMLHSEATVDAAPVVHGRWVDQEWDYQWQSMIATCSHCLTRGEVRVRTEYEGKKVIDSPCCPNCGAKME